MVYLLPFVGEVAIDNSRMLSAQQITANLRAIYNVLCWSLYQVNVKYSPQILTNLSWITIFQSYVEGKNAWMYRKCADVRMLKIFSDRLALAS